MRYYFFKFGQWCVNHLSLSLSYKIAGFLSSFHYYLCWLDRHAVKDNLKVLFPGKDISVIAKGIFQNFGKYLVEFFRMKKDLNKDFIRENIQIKGLEKLKDVLARGKGGIFLTAHLGNWELGAAVMSLMGYPQTVIALPHKEESVNNLFNEQRKAQGIDVVPINVGLRKCLEVLSQNKLIAILGERGFTDSGVVLDFFGKKTLIPKGAAVFSLKTGAAIVPCFLLRKKDNTFDLIIEDPIYPLESKKSITEEDKVISLAKKYLAVIEKMIKKYPEQWIMFRRFWMDEHSAKTRGQSL